MSTPHIEAAVGAIADTVLLPGDPLRARFLAQTLLEAPVQVNARRNMLGYTGTFRGQRISVLGSGMGIPSCTIYATELARFHGVKRIVECAPGKVLAGLSRRIAEGVECVAIQDSAALDAALKRDDAC